MKLYSHAQLLKTTLICVVAAVLLTAAICVNISKNNLDSSIMTINKRYSINHVDAYADYNGDYILCRKREFYLREDETYILNTIFNFRMFEE